MRVLGLFSGIGGFELGFQRAGFEIAAMCEIEPYCQAVLKKHWPSVPVFNDVRGVTYDNLRILDLLPDVITGGFPCQDISLAGKGAGLEGERSGLWREFHRVIAETRPRYAVIENVSALRSRGLDTVLRQLAEIRYDAEWHCIPASAVGAPHRRDRVWIVAHARCERGDGRRGERGGPEAAGPRDRAARSGEHAVDVADANLLLGDQRGSGDATQEQGRRDTNRSGVEPDDMANSHQSRLEIRLQGDAGEQPASVGGGWWLAEPDVGRVAHGVSFRVDRLRGLGNAVVPQIPEILARAILSHGVLS